MSYSRQRNGNLYHPKAKKPYVLSRWRVERFIRCPRCFYLDRKLGIEPNLGPYPYPGTPHLGNAVHALLKKEFDVYRRKRELHPYIKESGTKALPLQHDELDSWRNWHHGVRYHHKQLNLILMGVIDDVWVDADGTLIVVDYKTASHVHTRPTNTNLTQSHKRQLEFYQWLFRKKGFKVSNIGIFVYCNGLTNRLGFEGRLDFEVKLLSYKGDTLWIDSTLNQAFQCLNRNALPDPDPNCVPCQYISTYNEMVISHNQFEQRPAA